MALIEWSAIVPGRRPRRSADLGRAGERVAARALRRGGYRVLARNLRLPMGELDLVALAPDRATIVFVEVKTRAVTAGRLAPPPEANVTSAKRRRLARLAMTVARRRDWLDRPLRIDVVAIDWPEHGRPVIRHYENAITNAQRPRRG